MKLKLSLVLNLALLAVVAVLLVREELRQVDAAVAAHYFPKKKFEVFAAPGPPPMPEKFDYRLEEPNQSPDPTTRLRLSAVCL